LIKLHINVCNTSFYPLGTDESSLFTKETSLDHFSGSPRRSQARPSVNWTTTLGLVVHAAADGIAMGAAAATHQVPH